MKKTTIFVEIKKVETGEVVTCVETVPVEDGEPDIYTRVSGNFGCVCNRHIKFSGNYAVTPCSTELYIIRIKDVKNNVIYDEFLNPELRDSY